MQQKALAIVGATPKIQTMLHCNINRFPAGFSAVPDLTYLLEIFIC
jgi:hypothetical protein